MTTSITFNNEQLAASAMSYIEEVTDTLGVSDPLMARMNAVHGKGKPSKAGGVNLIIPLGWDDPSLITPQATGYEAVDMTIQEALRPAVYDWFYATKPIALSWIDDLQNAGEYEIVDLLEAKIKATVAGFMRGMQQQTLTGGLAKFAVGARQANSLNGITYAYGNLEAAAPGTGAQTHTVGGIGKTNAYTNGKYGWENQYQNVAANFGANGLTMMDQMSIAAANFRTNSGKGMGWYMNSATKANLRRALRVNERYVEEKTLDGGRQVLLWDGAPVESSIFVPANVAYMLDVEEIFYMWQGDHCFKLSPFVDGLSGGYVDKRAVFTLAYQLVTKNMATSGILQNTDTY